MNRIRLPHDGAEYAHFTFSPLPLPAGVLLEAQIGDTWYPIDQTASVPRLLLRGPDAPSAGGGVLVTKDQTIRVRVTDAPERIVRGAGYVVLVR